MLTLLEAEKWLKEQGHPCSTKTLRKYINNGRLPKRVEMSKHGNRYMLTEDELRTLFEHGTSMVPAEATPTMPTMEEYRRTLETSIENTLLSMESRLLEQIDARLEARDKLLLEAIRTRQEEKKPLLRRFVEWWKG